MKNWTVIKTIPMTEEELKENNLQKGDKLAVTYLNAMPDDGEVIWVTTTKGEVKKEVCVHGYGLYLLGSDNDWSEILAWMPVEIPSPYRRPDPRPIDATALLREIDANPWATPGDIVSMIHRQPTFKEESKK